MKVQDGASVDPMFLKIEAMIHRRDNDVHKGADGIYSIFGNIDSCLDMAYQEYFDDPDSEEAIEEARACLMMAAADTIYLIRRLGQHRPEDQCSEADGG